VAAEESKIQRGGAAVQNELYTRSPIEIYTNTLSAAPGEEITLHISTTARHFDLQIARIGLEETPVWTRKRLPGSFHPTPEDAWEKGCRWPAAVRLKIPGDWKSGYYQIKAITADEGIPPAAFYAFVVLRALQPTAKILLVLATNTAAAYNNYGGASFYLKKGGTLRAEGLTGTTGEHKVSFQRPLMPGFLWKPDDYRIDAEVDAFAVAAENFDLTENRLINKRNGMCWNAVAGGFHNWERVMVRWLERHGYAVDYAVSSDLELHPELLRRYRLMLSVGHDEYWSWAMRDTVEAFVAQGGNVCFFSGNVAMWKVRYEDQGRCMVGYKDEYREDPYFQSGQKQLMTGYWSSHYVGRPETQLTGLSAWYGGMAGFFSGGSPGGRGYNIYRSEHWVFKDTGLAFGDNLGQASNIVHYELDGCPIRLDQGIPYPAAHYEGPRSLEILAMTPVSWGDSLGGKTRELAKEVFGDANPNAVDYVTADRHHTVMSLYTQGGTVFSAGTTDWTSGLSGQDPTLERVTRNLLDRLSA
jgi:hypothetical protein